MNGVTLWLDGLNLIMKISNLIGIDFSHPPGDLSHRICKGHRRSPVNNGIRNANH